MAIIALKAWYLERYEPLRDVVERSPDLRLNRNSLLKSGLRADFLDDSLAVQSAPWFERYLLGEPVTFYIEGSGSYQIANLDIVSQEIYFIKAANQTPLDPVILLAAQQQTADSQAIIETVLEETVTGINRTSNTPLRWETLLHSPGAPLRLTDSQLRPLRKCLLLIADVTPISVNADSTPPRLLPDPLVCAQLGYALHAKKPGQILLLSHHHHSSPSGILPFDVVNHHQLSFTDAPELRQSLAAIMTTALHPFNLQR